ncbi:hypothetical protein [Demequina aurantiaca]|uniref:hypothetical protein n=1 Tax=Demequina aurantiaca TaxID=676200 RepID=UPI0007853264|nr:hypothetical protein [Demequina aurantiaca]
MEFFEGYIYPLVLGFSALLALTGIVTLIWIRAHRVLTWVVTAAYVVTLIEVLAIINALLGGGIPLVITIGYLLAAIALMPLLGIGRLGEPDAAAEDPDPNRPVLAPDQIARVDGAVAIIVAIAMSVVAWRVFEIFQGVH